MESSTAALRKAAPEWSLAGDRNLLQTLEDIHQKLMAKCQEVNTKLDDMVNKLDNASIDLQNVNNKFLALSNSQFIESRVYDDDITSDGEQEKKIDAPVNVNEENEIAKLKHSLQIFERMHEAVRILDSDSSDDEEDFSTILKPKDMYSGRPLPYIIGSNQWKTKWHVGLAPSESDSDNSEELMKRTEPQEQYSESESEDEGTYQKEAAYVSSSSDMEFEPSPGPSGVKPADIAAQIAKRFAAQQPPLETESRESSIPESGPRKVYRPERPGTIPIFSEEPPPLDNSFDDYSDNYSDEEHSGSMRIFPEMHRKPVQKETESRAVDPFVDKLFDDEINQVKPQQEEKVSKSVATPIIIKSDSVTNLLPQQEAAKSNDTGRQEQTVKKPVGGMSLFGSSQGAESIGAAILKRNQRKSSSSDDDDKPVDEKTKTDQPSISIPTSANKIIDDLFTKPKSSKKDSMLKGGKVTTATTRQKINPKPKVDLFSDNIFDDVDDIFTSEIVSKPKDSITEKVTAAITAQEIKSKAKIDLFSDNIFDDVDDIFTSEIISKPKEINKKSMFDDDDLFADVPIKTDVKNSKTTNIFDSDDELFKEDVKESATNNNKKPVLAEINESSKNKNTGISIFSDDSDDIFALNNDTPKTFQSQTMEKNPDRLQNKSDKHSINTVDNIKTVEINKHELKVQHIETESNTLKPTLQPKKFDSPLLFDDDDIDDLFKNNVNDSNKIEEIFNDDSVIKEIKDTKEKLDEASEQQLIKGTDLVVNNIEFDADLLKSTMEEEHNKNTPDSILKVVNMPDKLITDNHDYDLQNTKNINFDDEESFSETKNTKPITDTNDYSLNAPAFDENVNSFYPTTTESFIKQDQVPHEKLDDLFSDVPPVFEKPSEPKKSKNVNALFDDDSDDEALFFRKSDVTDEKPKLYNDDRFRIFHDEPPDVDVDFTTKLDETLKNNISEEDLFASPNYNLSSENTLIDNKPLDVKLSHDNIKKDDDIIVKTHENIENKKEESLDISELLSSEIVATDSKCNSEISKTNKKQTLTNKHITSEVDKKDTESKTKKSIGKLKPMNININVHSLLPGASPTKQKTKDESDGTVFSSQSNEELNKYSTEKEESKMVKSVSFDGDPGSEILDNKLSKERARIQVKRRPSSRRARLEAVRKSGIDFADDSTDNSSSFDEPQPVSSHHGQSSESKVPITNSSDFVCNRSENTDIENEVSSNKTIGNLEDIATEVKSKTVYILHDEDIFSNSPNTKTDNVKKSLTILDVDDNDDLFKIPISISTKKNKTSEKPKEAFKEDINKNYNKNNEDVLPKATKSTFDDFSDDDELFGGKKSSASGTSKPKDKNTNHIKQSLASIKTGSLFGDDSDDDDLFKTAKRTEVMAKPKESTKLTSATVKDDPLSLFDDS